MCSICRNRVRICVPFAWSCVASPNPCSPRARRKLVGTSPSEDSMTPQPYIVRDLVTNGGASTSANSTCAGICNQRPLLPSPIQRRHQYDFHLGAIRRRRRQSGKTFVAISSNWLSSSALIPPQVLTPSKRASDFAFGRSTRAPPGISRLLRDHASRQYLSWNRSPAFRCIDIDWSTRHDEEAA